MSDITQGEWIDKISIDEIINHPQFIRLEVFKRFDTMTGQLVSNNDYWEITFEGIQNNDGLYRTFFNQLTPYKHFKLFKLKD